MRATGMVADLTDLAAAQDDVDPVARDLVLARETLSDVLARRPAGLS